MPFGQVIGHRTLVALLARSIARDSLPPSLIFAGPAGVGKRLTALAMAQALNCLNPVRGQTSAPGEPASAARPTQPVHAASEPAIDACGTCASCVRIARRAHADVLLIEPGDSGSIKTEPIRDVIDKSAYRPFEGRRRVVIIDDADALVPGAQNALLKTLEEPPSASMFVLVTSRPDALLPTVQSRCPRLRFGPLSAADVAAALMAQGRSPEDARAVAAASDGSIATALQASAGDLVESRTVAARVLVHAASTTDPRRRIESAKDLLPKTGTSAADRDQLSTYLRALASLLRDLALVAAGGRREALADPAVEAVLPQLSAFRGERAIHAFAIVDEALAALERNAGAKTVADWVLVHV